MKRLALALALLLAAAFAAAQTPDRYKPDPNLPPVKRGNAAGVPGSPRLTLGSVAKGDRAPDFELRLAGGGKVRLSTLRGQWVVVCFSHRDSIALVDSLARAAPERVPVLGVIGEKAGALTAWAERTRTRALLLDDSRGDIAALYGAFDLERDRTKTGYVIVDPKGIVNRAELTGHLSPEEAARAVQYAVTGL